MNKDEAMMELDRLNREYPVDSHARKMRPLIFGDTTPPTAQRQSARSAWVGLTDEAIWSEYQTLWPFHPAEEPRLAKDIAKFARAIEAKLKAKNFA